MRIRVGDLEFSASIAEVAERGLTIQFRAPKVDMHEALLQAAAGREHVFSPEDDREWRIADVSFAYVGSEPWGMHHHTWRLEQVTRVAAGAVRIGSLELEPYDYGEDTDPEGMLRFALRAPVDDSQLHALAELCGTVLDVAQQGQPPRRMLLEAFVWGGSGSHGQAVALRCTEAVEPRVTLTGASAVEISALLLRKGLLGVEDLLQPRHVSDIDAWEL